MAKFQPGNKAAVGHKKMSKEFREELEKLTFDALKTLKDIVKNGANEKNRILSAQVLLDRCYGRPGQAIRVDHNTPIDSNAVMAALADQARGILIDTDEDGVQRFMVSPGMQLPAAIPVEVETLQ